MSWFDWVGLFLIVAFVMDSIKGIVRMITIQKSIEQGRSITEKKGE